jgi:putative transposase
VNHLPANSPKRRVKAKLRDDRKDAVQINEKWAMDFVHHQWATGTKIRILTIVDTFSRFSPIVDPRLSYRSEDVVQTLERVYKVDQGSKFISRDLDLWAYHKGVILELDAPRPPSALTSRKAN